MSSLLLLSADEAAAELGRRARERRLERNLSQQGLAERSGVPLGTLKRFERTGQVALPTLLRIAVALDAMQEIETWFQAPEVRSIDEALARQKPRYRGRNS